MKNRYYNICIGILFSVSIIGNILAWNSRGFSDAFREFFFQKVSPVQSFISSLFPFSVGEIMIVLGIALIVVLILVCIFCILFQKNAKVRAFGKCYIKVFFMILGIVSVIMTMNCFIVFHCSDFESLYMEDIVGKEYTVEELILVRDYVIEQADSLSYTFERDENGYIQYNKDIGKQAQIEMKHMGDKYSLLKGYYPRPKPIASSKFLSQQYMLGYYFPFSMEANYNKQMYHVNMPATMCHELSHLKGFMYEDDANFIGYLACIQSEDPFFRYSGYVSMLDYLNNDLYENLNGNIEAYLTYKQCNELVAFDNMFLTPEAWQEVEESALIDTEVVKEASHNFVEMNLNLNGIEEGLANYGEVVEYLLKYYDGVLYESK